MTVLVSISILYVSGSSLISSALPAAGNDSNYQIASMIGDVAVFATPFMIYLFIAITTYIMIQVFCDTEHINQLLRKLWIIFLPILLSSLISYVVLLEIDNYDLTSANEEGILHIQLGFGLTLEHLKIISNCAYVVFFALLTMIIMREFGLGLLKSLISSVSPSLFALTIRYFLF